MQTIVITGPSGSGKTILSNKLAKLFNDTIIIKTDSYYRDDFYIKFLSLFYYDIYDRFISIKDNEIIKTINSIYNKDYLTTFYDYDFKNRISSKYISKINREKNFKFIILEGIFSHRLDLNYENTINIICKQNKEICYQRRLDRDKRERGRNKKEVKKKFRKSWELFFTNLQTYKKNNKIISLNPIDKKGFDNLINILREI